MKKQAFAACLVVVCTAVCGVFADDVPGFLPETVVIAPGNGVATNVAATLSGMYNVQAGSGATGGGIVTLSALNRYMGGTYVKSGTLVANTIENLGVPNSLGVGAGVTNAIVLGNGTLRYTGPDASTDRDVLILMPAGAEKHAGVLDLEHDLTFSGRFSAVNGCLIKKGPGTMTIASPATIPGCRNSFYGGTLGDINQVPNIGANGDGATVGIAGFIILNGRVVIDTPDTVTNYFGNNEFVVGRNSTTASNAETPAHLEIRGGYNNLGNFLAIGRANGNTTTAPDGLSSTVTISGGYTWAQNVSMGYTINNQNVTAKPVLNVVGGELRAGYLRLCDHPSQGYVTVNVTSGGILRSTGAYGGGQNVGGGKIYINVSSNGTFRCDTNFNTFQNSGASNTCIIKLFDDGILQANNFTCAQAGTARIEADGGILKPNGTIHERIVLALGEKGLKLQPRGNTAISSPVQTLAGVANDGGITISGGSSVTFAGQLSFTGPVTVTDNSSLVFNGVAPQGPVVMNGTGMLRCTAPATFSSLVNGANASFGFTLDNGTVSAITLNAWQPPRRLSVYFVNKGTTDPVTTAGTYDLLNFPASVDFDASRVVCSPLPENMNYAFSIATSGSVKTLRVTIGASAVNTATWTNAAGGDWNTGANWDGNVVPTSAGNTLASFPTEAQAGGASVTLGSAFTLGGVTVNSASPYTFAGNGTLTFSGDVSSGWTSAEGSHAVNLPISLNGAVGFTTVGNTTLTLGGTISGGGSLVANAVVTGAAATNAVSGSGTVALSDNNDFTGDFRQRSGTVVAAKLANAGSASSIGAGAAWTLGRGTFHYTGPDVTIDRPLFLDTGDGFPVNMRLDHDLTLTAPVTQVTGDLLKTGPGTLTLAGPGTNILGNASGAQWLGGNPAALSNMIDANGEPTRWHCAVLIADGKVSWGVPGQVVKVPYDEVWVGSHTTPNANEETTGELEITGGETYFPSHLVIGRNNGLPSTIGGDGIARPTVTVRGGYFNPEKVIMCYDNFENTTSKTYATLNVLGGTMEVNTEFRLGFNNGGGSKATVNVANGAQFIHRNTGSYYFRMGQGGVENELNVSGAGTLFWEQNNGYIILGYNNSTSVVNLADGATIRCFNFSKRDGGTAYLNWNGGTIQLTANEPFLNAFNEIRLGANQGVFDATMISRGSQNMNNSIVSDPALNGARDGGILVRGDEARIAFFRGTGGKTYTFTGDLVAEAGSALGIADIALTTQTVRLQNGATLRVAGDNKNRVADLVFGETAGDTTRLILNSYGAHYIQIENSLMVNGTLEFNTYHSGTNLYPVAGTWKVMSGPTGCFDTSKYRMDSRFPGFVATFTVTALNSSTDELSVTFAPAASTVHTWRMNGGGTWGDAANWDTLPTDAAGDQVIFPSTLTANGTVSLGATRTVGKISSDSPSAVTLSGGTLALDDGPYAVPTVVSSAGTLALPAVTAGANGATFTPSSTSTQRLASVTSSGAVTANPAGTGGGRMILDGPFSAPSLTVKSGTIQGAPARFGNTPLSLGAATLRFTESGVFRSALTPTIASGESLVVRAEENTEVYIDKAFSNNGSFLKTGKGTVVLNGSGTIKLAGGAKSPSTVPVLAENGDAPSTGYPAGMILNGKMVWGREGQTVNVKGKDVGEFWIGAHNFLNEDGTPMTGELEIRGGTTVFDNFLVVGRSHASYEINSVPLRPTLTILGGDVTAKEFILAWDSSSKMNLIATLNVHDGAVFRSKGRFCLGNHGNGGHADTLEAVVNQYGGEIHASGEAFNFGYASGGAPSARATFNQYGGLLVTDSANAGNRKVRLGLHGARSRMNLHGGVVQSDVIGVASTTVVSTAEIFWNGGCFRPGAAGQTAGTGLTLNMVSTNGANFDLSLLAAGETLTWNVPFTHDPALEGEDGGIMKTGAGTLVLAKANTLTGLVKVEAGEVLAQVDGAVAPGVELGADAVLNGNALSQTLARIKGTGACSNGTFRVTGSVAPGADGHAAGARVTVTDLTLASGASIVCTADDTGSACDLVKVTGNLVTEGVVTVDLGRDAANPLETTFAAKVAEIDGTVTLGGSLSGTGCGIPGHVVVVHREGNEIWARVIPGGTMLIFR